MNSNRIESRVYLGLWALVISIFLLDAFQSNIDDMPALNTGVIMHGVMRLAPFVMLFAVNNFVLIPRWLKSNRYGYYLASVIILLGVVLCSQYYTFMQRDISMGPPPNSRPHLIPMPIIFDLSYDILIIGVNCAICLMFQTYYDKLEYERLRKVNAESQLEYLKAQINPHFYMNMLNNIHGMIEIDSARAQQMVIDMSRLMRYMLYESSSAMISLGKEIDFLSKYIDLMRSRFPEHKVTISKKFPSAADVTNINVPPLIFLVFVENAFKHGVSFKEQSCVTVEISVSDDTIMFKCLNTVHATAQTEPRSSGIGLINVSQRLELIYGKRATVAVSTGENYHCVTLTIPTTNETQNNSN